MAVDIEELLHQAKQLAVDYSEISQRAAASRGYYYAYHKCLAFADSNSFDPPEYASEKGGLHHQLIQQFLQYRDSADAEKSKRARCVGHILTRMRAIRTHADYKLVEDFGNDLTTEMFLHISNMAAKLAESA